MGTPCFLSLNKSGVGTINDVVKADLGYHSNKEIDKKKHSLRL
jgi:hypothetical protein